jgi:hypothetical protein
MALNKGQLVRSSQSYVAPVIFIEANKLRHARVLNISDDITVELDGAPLQENRFRSCPPAAA